MQSLNEASKLSKEWVLGARQRMEIAHSTRLSNPRLSMEILLQVVDELLRRLPEA